jgi:hypothetical protein
LTPPALLSEPSVASSRCALRSSDQRPSWSPISHLVRVRVRIRVRVTITRRVRARARALVVAERAHLEDTFLAAELLLERLLLRLVEHRLGYGQGLGLGSGSARARARAGLGIGARSTA